MELSADLVDLLRAPSICHVATTMPDGSPQLTLTWVDTDGEHVLINTVEGHQKVRNLRRDPRVAVTITDPATPSRYVGIRGRVVEITGEGAAEHIELLAQRYTGRAYQWYGGRDQQRLLLRIEPRRIHRMG
jgi:PPOX class probable F420-dependent enzyme